MKELNVNEMMEVYGGDDAGRPEPGGCDHVWEEYPQHNKLVCHACGIWVYLN